MFVFIGGNNRCGVHNEKETLIRMFKDSQFKIINNYQHADLIILTDTCICTMNSIVLEVDYLKKVAMSKKAGARVILSGCFVNGLKIELPDSVNRLVRQFESVPMDNLIQFISDEYFSNDFISQDSIPYTEYGNTGIQLSPVEGCLNRCSFCKTQYANFPLRSYPIESIQRFADNQLTGDRYKTIDIVSSNLSQYGIDIYNKKQRAHEVIQILTAPDNINYAFIGALINFYPELIDEIISNPKIKTISVSLETGSPRLYAMMNRPIQLEHWIEIVKLIRQERPDIRIITEIIAGFPTETVNDIKMTISLIKSLGIYTNGVHPYFNFPGAIPSSKYPQHSHEYISYSRAYYMSQLSPLNQETAAVLNDTITIIYKDAKLLRYVGLYSDGSERIISFDALPFDCEVGQVISGSLIIPKYLTRRLKSK